MLKLKLKNWGFQRFLFRIQHYFLIFLINSVYSGNESTKNNEMHNRFRKHSLSYNIKIFYKVTNYEVNKIAQSQIWQSLFVKWQYKHKTLTIKIREWKALTVIIELLYYSVQHSWRPVPTWLLTQQLRFQSFSASFSASQHLDWYAWKSNQKERN